MFIWYDKIHWTVLFGLKLEKLQTQTLFGGNTSKIDFDKNMVGLPYYFSAWNKSKYFVEKNLIMVHMLLGIIESIFAFRHCYKVGKKYLASFKYKTSKGNVALHCEK